MHESQRVSSRAHQTALHRGSRRPLSHFAAPAMTIARATQRCGCLDPHHAQGPATAHTGHRASSAPTVKHARDAPAPNRPNQAASSYPRSTAAQATPARALRGTRRATCSAWQRTGASFPVAHRTGHATCCAATRGMSLHVPPFPAARAIASGQSHAGASTYEGGRRGIEHHSIRPHLSLPSRPEGHRTSMLACRSM